MPAKQTRASKVAVRSKRATPVVEALPPDSKDPRWVRVLVTDAARAVARLPREALTEMRLDVGTAWTPATAKRVQDFVAHRQAREAALGLLAKSAQSAASIKQRLTARKFNAAIVAKVTEELTEDGWLNDDRHAEDRAGSLAAKRPGLSEDAAAGLLEAQGVDRTRALRHGLRVSADSESRSSGLDLARRAIRARGKKSAYAVATMLARRGVDEAIIMDALAKEGFDVES